MKALHGIAFVLVIIGGLNWLIVGLFGVDIGTIFGGQTAIIPKIIYILVGLSTVLLIVTHKKDCKSCAKVTPASAPVTPSNPM